MDARTLATAMGRTVDLSSFVPAFDAALRQAGCTTILRAAMFCAQVGHESAGLRYMAELASGQDYEGRRDLGNVQAGDGRRYKGRGPIQVTGRHNYTELSEWAHAHGYVPTDRWFVDHPVDLESPRYGFLGAAWYWTVARPKLNAYADDGAIVTATKAINGGTHGLADRKARYARCLRLGGALLPTGAPPAATPVPRPATGHVPARGDTLRLGDTGPEVARWQAFAGASYSRFGPLHVDGDFGGATERFTRDIQRFLGLDDDGEVGPTTKRKTNYPK